MPVLTADTLAARADRDSAAAQHNDVLAGRKRAAAAGSDVDSGPEIIAPPQALSGDSLIGSASGKSNGAVRKPGSRSKAQKSITPSKRKSKKRKQLAADSNER